MANKALINYYAKLVSRGDKEEKEVPPDIIEAVRAAMNKIPDPVSTEEETTPSDHTKPGDSYIDEAELDRRLGEKTLAAIDAMFSGGDGCDGNCAECGKHEDCDRIDEFKK